MEAPHDLPCTAPQCPFEMIMAFLGRERTMTRSIRSQAHRLQPASQCRGPVLAAPMASGPASLPTPLDFGGMAEERRAVRMDRKPFLQSRPEQRRQWSSAGRSPALDPLAL